jgi:hypothetical protein
MKTMRERLARIIDPRAWSSRVTRGPAKDFRKESALQRADAILDELREPDEGMLKAAREAPMPLPNLDSLSARWDLVNATHWRAMIDHARQERSTPEG